MTDTEWSCCSKAAAALWGWWRRPWTRLVGWCGSQGFEGYSRRLGVTRCRKMSQLDTPYAFTGSSWSLIFYKVWFDWPVSSDLEHPQSSSQATSRASNTESTSYGSGHPSTGYSLQDTVGHSGHASKIIPFLRECPRRSWIEVDRGIKIIINRKLKGYILCIFECVDIMMFLYVKEIGSEREREIYICIYIYIQSSNPFLRVSSRCRAEHKLFKSAEHHPGFDRSGVGQMSHCGPTYGI